jgi:hypothetical protein
MRVDEAPLIEVGPRDRIKPILVHLQAELERIAELSDRRMAGR